MYFSFNLVLILIIFNIVVCKKLVELQGINFELALASHKYIAILFYDNSANSAIIEMEWSNACKSISTLPAESEMAKISGIDPDLKEIIDAYSISLPSIRVFRKGIMTDYRGPFDKEGIAKYIIEDAKPSVNFITSTKEMKVALGNNLNTVVFGMMNTAEQEDVEEGYSIDPWGQFQAAADSLRGHASFYIINSEEVLTTFKLTESDFPAVYMVSSEGDGFLKYSGEILEINLSEWILRNSAPKMGELTVSTPSGEMFATQFFSSRKLKFILFLSPAMADPAVITAWREISNTFKGKAIFSYLTQNTVADVTEYFDIKIPKDLPLIAAHQPTTDRKFKSKQINLSDFSTLQDFVTGVITGHISHILKSEPIPLQKTNLLPNGKSIVINGVGNNIIDLVNSPGKDVLVAVYTPFCDNCKSLFPTYDILVRAVAADPRIMIVKINAAANDIPSAWGVKGYPTLLWFPAKDKPYKKTPMPRPYWDAGFSLQELVGFVQREGSFDQKTLKVATNEQLHTLLSEEEPMRLKYEKDERDNRRNEGRDIYENKIFDYLLGEVVFDGKRYHIVIAAVLLLSFIILLVYVTVFKANSNNTIAKKRK